MSIRERTYAQLDGLRGIAVLAVLVQHTFGIQRETAFAIWAPGPAGVRLFFVLSGFLITGILLEARDRAEAQGTPLIATLRAFYIRRFLRIFPLYYMTLLVAALLGIDAMRHWPWFVTYASNVLNVIHTSAVGSASHFWSLAIEEQFYLGWPWIMLFTPRRKLPHVLIGAIALAGVTRILLVSFGWAYAAYVLTLPRLDSLAAGGLLAYLGIGSRAISTCGWVAICSALLLFWLPSQQPAVMLASEWCGIAGSLWLVARAAQGFTGRSGALLARGPLAGLGVISYGIYVIHRFVPEAVNNVEAMADVWLRMPPHVGFPRFIYVLITTIVAASLSWWVMEAPLNRLKRHFPYVRRRPAASPRVQIDAVPPEGSVAT
jgi:peptidoglycan/LPS O-acetylase OafA/YrhL